MELDLAAVTLFSSAAVRVVLAIARIARDEGWRLVVHAPERRGHPARPRDQRPRRPGRPALSAPVGGRRAPAAFADRSGAHPPGVRLRRSDVNGPGYRRRRAGRGFAYYDIDGALIRDDRLDRIRGLAIPPAWRDVWICPWPNGHIQATGVDAAGRRQYRYHDQWRARRDAEKHERVLEIARQLPDVRDAVRSRRCAPAGSTASGCWRPPSGCSTSAPSASAASSTRRRTAPTAWPRSRASTSRVRGERTFFSYTAKGGIEREVELTDRPTATVVRQLLERPGGRRGGAAGLPDRGRRVAGRHQRRDQRLPQGDQRRGDHRQGLPDLERRRCSWRPRWPRRRRRASRTARKKVVSAAYKQVSEQLGNTPAVCKASYVDPRVVDRFEHGETVAARAARRRRRPRPTATCRRCSRQAVCRLLSA